MQHNKLTIHVNGMKYPIVTPEEPSYVAGLAQEIDSGLRQLMDNGSSMGDALVLLCLSYLDSWKKADQNADNLRDQVSSYLEDASKARMELGEAKREIERLSRLLEDAKGARE